MLSEVHPTAAHRGDTADQGADRARLAVGDDFSPTALLTLPEVAFVLRLDRDHRDGVSAVRYLVRTRRLRAVKVGKTWRIRRSWLDDFLERESVPPIQRH